MKVWGKLVFKMHIDLDLQNKCKGVTLSVKTLLKRLIYTLTYTERQCGFGRHYGGWLGNSGEIFHLQGRPSEETGCRQRYWVHADAVIHRKNSLEAKFCKGLQLTELISRIIFLKNPLLSQTVGAYTVNPSRGRGKRISGLLSKSQDS